MTPTVAKVYNSNMQPLGAHTDSQMDSNISDRLTLPAWIPDAVRLYLDHTETGLSLRAIARRDGRHASTILRQVRRYEGRRDDPLLDEALESLVRPNDGAESPDAGLDPTKDEATPDLARPDSALPDFVSPDLARAKLHASNPAHVYLAHSDPAKKDAPMSAPIRHHNLVLGSGPIKSLAGVITH